jgi:hypothetical protein
MANRKNLQRRTTSKKLEKTMPVGLKLIGIIFLLNRGEKSKRCLVIISGSPWGSQGQKRF